MSTTAIVVQGIIKADGTLELDESGVRNVGQAFEPDLMPWFFVRLESLTYILLRQVHNDTEPH